MTSGEPQDPEEESQAGSSAAVPPAPTPEEQVKDATPGMYWQKLDDFNLPSADTADYAGKTDPPKEDASL